MTSKLPESVFLLTSHFTKGFRLPFVGEKLTSASLPIHYIVKKFGIYIIPYIVFLSIYFR